MGSDEVRIGMFMTGQFPFKYDWFVSTTCCEVVPGFRTMKAQQMLPDKMVIVQNKTRSVYKT